MQEFAVQLPGTQVTKLLTDFGIVQPGPQPLWVLSNLITPVSIVNTQVPLTAVLTEPSYTNRATAGHMTAQVAGTRFADTGALNLGVYWVWITGTVETGAAIRRWNIRRRNAADAGDIWQQYFYLSNNTTTGQPFFMGPWAETLAQNERLVVEVDENMNAGEDGHFLIHFVKIA